MCNNVRLRFVCCCIRLNCLLALCWFPGHIILFGQMIDRLRAKRIMMHTVPSKQERRMCFILNENELDCYARYQIVLVTCVMGRFQNLKGIIISWNQKIFSIKVQSYGQLFKIAHNFTQLLIRTILFYVAQCCICGVKDKAHITSNEFLATP